MQNEPFTGREVSGLENILPGQYLPVESPIHRLDSRTKIISSLAVMTAVLIPGWAGPVLASFPVCAGVLLARISPRLLWMHVRSVRLIMAVTFLFQTLFTPGDVLLGAGPLSVTVQGIQSGVDLLLRIALIFTAGIILTSTTSPLSLASGMEYLFRPLGRLGLPVHEMVMAVTMAMRFVPVIFEEARTIMSAQISRGAGFYGPGLARRAAAVTALMVPLLVGAFRRSEDLAAAMEARCYRGGTGRTRIDEPVFSTGDVICAVICGVTPVAAVLLRTAAV